MKKLTLIFFLIPVGLLAQITYVDIDATGTNDGSSWENAYNDLAEALDNAQYGDSLWVAEGTYFPTSDTDRHKHFTLKNGVKIIGGFAGTETEVTQRNWEINLTVLDGNIGDPLDSLDNSYTVLFIEPCDSTTVIDGLQVQNGHANGTGSFETEFGGGVYIDLELDYESRPQIMNCTFFNNFAQRAGGALSVRPGPNSSIFARPLIKTCNFRMNIAGGSGGGVFINRNPKMGSLEITNSSFVRNEILNSANFNSDGAALLLGANQSGNFGAVMFYINNCVFQENYNPSHSTGETLYFEANIEQFSLILDSCLFIANVADSGSSSAIEINSFSSNTEGQVIIQNSIFQENYSESGTIGFHEADINFTVTNCHFVNNISQDRNAIIGATGNTKILNCLFENNQTLSYDAGFAVFSSNPGDSVFIANCTFVNNGSNGHPFFEFGSSLDDTVGPFRIENCAFLGQDYNPYFEDGTYFSVSGEIDLVVDNSLIDVPICSMPADSNLVCGPGLIYAEPIFVDSAGGDFRLAPCSPGVNVGNNAVWADHFPDTDLAGQARIQEEIIDIGAYELPALALATDSTSGFICAGDTLGSITFAEPVSACAPYTITAPDGSVSTELHYGSLPEGSYTYILEDALGRSDTTTVVFTEPEALSVTAQITDATNGQSNDGSIEITGINGGIPPYELIWSHGQTEALITDLEPALYALTIIDSLGCELVEYFLVGTITTTEEVSATEELLLYPNPANSFLNLILPDYRGGTFDLKITDLNGRELYRQSGFRVSGKQEIRLDISEFPTGTFFIRLYTSDSFAFARFVKV